MAKNSNMQGESSALRRTCEVLEAQLGEPLEPGLYLVSTPIGNLADITLRALAVLACADLIFCEDTRHSLKLLNHFGISGKLESYHEHNAARERPRMLARIRAGFSVALIADAGTPLISDPGFKLVREALDEGLAVVSIPGPAAPIAALTASGLASDRFFFEGFLPPKQTARRKRLEALAGVPATLILFERATRIEAVLRDMAETLGSRTGAVAKELTKKHETVLRAPLGKLADRVASWPETERRGEFVILVEAAPQKAVSDAAIRSRLAALMGDISVRDAARDVADDLGVQRKRVYKIALALASDGR